MGLPLGDLLGVRQVLQEGPPLGLGLLLCQRHDPQQLLCDGALDSLAALMEAMEWCSSLPEQVEMVTIILLVKPVGGLRPIGLYPSVYRLWARLCRRECRAWELAHRRDYFACSVKCSCIDPVWRQGVRAEASASGGSAAYVLWDGVKFYESFVWQKMLERGTRLGSPWPSLGLLPAPTWGLGGFRWRAASRRMCFR